MEFVFAKMAFLEKIVLKDLSFKENNCLQEKLYATEDGLEKNVTFKAAEIIAITEDFVTMELANVIRVSQENFAKIKNALVNAMRMEPVLMVNVFAIQVSKELIVIKEYI